MTQRDLFPPSELGKRYYLSQAEIFRQVLPHQMEEIEHSTRMFSCPKGTLLYSPEDQGEVFFVLKRGRVQLYRLSPQGRKIVLADLRGGACFGELALAGVKRYDSFAEAIEESLLCSLHRQDMMGLLVRYPQVGLNLLESVAGRLAETEQRLEELAFKGVAARLSALLLRLPRSAGGEISGFAHSDLADIVGAHRETVTVVLNQFEAAGWLRSGRKSLTITDEAGLRRLSEGSAAG